MARAKELEQTAMAITDHGVMFGAIDFFRAAQANQIKPIIGMEAYLAPRIAKNAFIHTRFLMLSAVASKCHKPHTIP